MNIIQLAFEVGLAQSTCQCPDCMPFVQKLERFAAFVRAEALAEPDIEEMTLTQIASRHEPVTQEPVAVVEITYGREPECYVTGNIDDFPEGVFKLYAAPVSAKCEWVDLTDDEIYPLYNEPISDREAIDFARAVIAAFKEKNK